MRFSSFGVLLALLGTGFATPPTEQQVLELDDDVKRAACNIKQPSILQYLYEGNPAATYPNIAGSNNPFRVDSRFDSNGKELLDCLGLSGSCLPC